MQIGVRSRELTESRSVSTNSQGVFEITELPAGRYTLTASRGGYLRLEYGQRHPDESGRPIQLADGQTVTDADFALPRASTIVGRITDEIGDPLANASIFPVQWKFFRGQRRLVPVSGGGTFNRTDDTGGYRITGLEPGRVLRVRADGRLGGSRVSGGAAREGDAGAHRRGATPPPVTLVPGGR